VFYVACTVTHKKQESEYASPSPYNYDYEQRDNGCFSSLQRPKLETTLLCHCTHVSHEFLVSQPLLRTSYDATPAVLPSVLSITVVTVVVVVLFFFYIETVVEHVFKKPKANSECKKFNEYWLDNYLVKKNMGTK
jgi:hypothetical protein